MLIYWYRFDYVTGYYEFYKRAISIRYPPANYVIRHSIHCLNILDVLQTSLGFLNQFLVTILANIGLTYFKINVMRKF